MSVTVSHAGGDRLDLLCDHCGTGVDIPFQFGRLDGFRMVVAFVELHTKPGRFCKAPKSPATRHEPPGAP